MMTYLELEPCLVYQIVIDMTILLVVVIIVVVVVVVAVVVVVEAKY